MLLRSSSTPTPLLDVRNLGVSFGGVRAADGISLSLARGELRCIIGPNGAGKSTFFKMLAGTVFPDEGRIFFNGSEITKIEPYLRARRGIGIKLQNVSVFDDLTVGHNLFLPLRRTIVRKDKIAAEVDRILDQINLRGMANRLARELSHGQKQWLSIGMTRALKPSLMLLDEPVAGMGPEETRDTAQIIRAANADGVTTLVVEHDMEFVRSLQSQVTVLHYGKTFAQGSLSEIEDNSEVRSIYLGNRKKRIVG